MAHAPWAAVVVNYNAGVHLDRCVGSLLADTSAGDPPDVVVVDNDSGDGSAEALTRARPEVEVVFAGSNLGYAAAANLGTAAARASVVAVLNPDAEVAGGAGGVMCERFGADAALGALGPRILNPDGSVYPSARCVPSPADAVGHAVCGLVTPENPFTRRYLQRDEDPSRPRDVDWLSGAAIWLRREAVDAVGGWDEGFFLFMEDVDLCWRLRRGGWRVAYEPRAEVTHVIGVSRATHPYRSIAAHHRSVLRFASKRWRGPQRLLLGPLAAGLTVRAAAAAAARGVGGGAGGPGPTG